MNQPVSGHFLTVGGRRAHFLQIGSGARTVVMLHGFASLAQEVSAPFAEMADVKILAFDRPGYGFTDPLMGPAMGPAAQARWLAEILDQLSQKHCVVVAHSMGAAPALWLAQRRPDLVSHLLLLAPYCRPTRKWAAALLHAARHPGTGPIINQLLIPSLAHRIGPRFLRSALFPNPVPRNLEDFPYRHAANPVALRSMALEYFGFQQDMPMFDRRQSLRSKITIVHGSEDRIALPPWHLEWLTRLGSRLEILNLPGVGHAPHHVEPALVRSTLSSLL